MCAIELLEKPARRNTPKRVASPVQPKTPEVPVGEERNPHHPRALILDEAVRLVGQLVWLVEPGEKRPEHRNVCLLLTVLNPVTGLVELAEPGSERVRLATLVEELGLRPNQRGNWMSQRFLLPTYNPIPNKE